MDSGYGGMKREMKISLKCISYVIRFHYFIFIYFILFSFTFLGQIYRHHHEYILYTSGCSAYTAHKTPHFTHIPTHSQSHFNTHTTTHMVIIVVLLFYLF